MSIATDLLRWYDEHHRILPWRDPIVPYHTWISEIMLQQTQVNTVIPYYYRFLEMFPDVEALANASEEQLMKSWEGLGYYSRVRNMQVAAREIVELGHFPNNYDDLLELKGIGPYTAGAIASIAFNEVVPAVDGNVLRIYTRLYEYGEDILKQKNIRVIKEYVHETMSIIRPGDFNQALMDLGSQICTPKNPKCDECPLKAYCQSYKHQSYENYPYKAKKQKVKDVYYLALALQYKNTNQFQMIKRSSKGILANMLSFPLIELTKDQYTAFQVLLNQTEWKVSENNNSYTQYEDFLMAQVPAVWQWKPLGEVEHIFTHRRWHLLIAYGITAEKAHTMIDISNPNQALPKVQHKLNEVVLSYKK